METSKSYGKSHSTRQLRMFQVCMNKERRGAPDPESTTLPPSPPPDRTSPIVCCRVASLLLLSTF
uniref:Uncharacterized protein n=2 Tax=Cucumis melo TaxID=3656 RepID=A0A9I9E042_CUCME